ncbi:hypothetical protein OCU04_005668 [Sclerotinia nivalis]|uniref:S-adenosyl-L-methionine-dependent methyltransferase n=1 Tax=Sclerotinia nivalis TaxID=352851 RepID=A0A9X0APL6_9HELO|nr:hypothetical protein OCU04_005668 [Sclerotinia nivalis]
MHSNQNITNGIYTSLHHDDGSAATETEMADTPELEVDSQTSPQSANNSDTDSSMGESFISSTASLRESIYKYVEENGRTYHAYNSGKYILPNDDAEQERLDLQHHLFSLSFDGALHLAPLPSKLHNVLDIGTGTGLWATEFAEQYPSAQIIGTDLSPIQPVYVPPNCSFEVNDAEEPWTYSHKFDYIHGRAMLSCFSDPAGLITSAYESLRPGGYLEMQDPQMPILGIDSSITGTALEEWGRVSCLAAERRGRKLTNSKHYGHWMAEAGFVDIVEKHFYWPCNTWVKGEKEKLLATWTQQNLIDGIQGMTMRNLTAGLGWSPEQVEMLLVDVRRDVKNRRIHSYIDVVVFYGRKPGPGDLAMGEGFA